jgi:hypothetical protein
MNPENACTRRWIEDNDDNTVTVFETWDLSSPDSPFIRIPWSPDADKPLPPFLGVVYRDVPKNHCKFKEKQ